MYKHLLREEYLKTDKCLCYCSAKIKNNPVSLIKLSFLKKVFGTHTSPFINPSYIYYSIASSISIDAHAFNNSSRGIFW